LTLEEIAALVRDVRSQLGPHFSLQPRLPNWRSAYIQWIDRTGVTAPEAVIAAVENALRTVSFLEPFAAEGFRTSPTPGSGASFQLELVVRWLLAASRNGDSLAALRRLEQIVRENAVECMEVLAVWGLNPTSPIDLRLAEGIRLVSLESLPDSHPKDVLLEVPAFEGDRAGPLRLVPRPGAALVHEFRHSPIFLRMGEDGNRGPSHDELMRDVALALALLNDTGTAPIAHWYQVVGDAPLLNPVGAWGGYKLEWTFLERRAPTRYDEDRAREIVHAYLSVVSARPYVREALSRLNRAMLEQEPAERAIELGIALDCLLLQRREPDKTRRIATRGAIALGGTSTVTARNESRLRALYGLRSDVVHEGVLPDTATWDSATVPTVEILKQGLAVCADLVRVEIRSPTPLKQLPA
jgi:hypothetical protein